METKFAKRLKEVRLENNLTQKELSRMLDTYQSTVAKWELGELEPSINMIYNICKALKVSADYLIGLID